MDIIAKELVLYFSVYGTAKLVAEEIAKQTGADIREIMLAMADEMLKRSDFFTPKNYVFYQKDGGYHDFNAVQEYLYNALPLFFPNQDGNARTRNVRYRVLLNGYIRS